MAAVKEGMGAQAQAVNLHNQTQHFSGSLENADNNGSGVLPLGASSKDQV